jgi:hypothetical protein
MQRVMINLFQSKARLMIILRDILVGLVAFLGVARLRILLVLLGYPETDTGRDALQYYLMAKAVISGINPYLSMNELAKKIVGFIQFFPHPTPSTPFTSILSIPLVLFSVNQAYIAWFLFEMICLALIAIMLSILWNERLNWMRAICLFFVLLSWYPIMVELHEGQLSILLTVLLLAMLLALRKERRILAGTLIGLSVAIKIITWPLFIYLFWKKDWRTLVAASITTLGLNLVSLIIIGPGPFMDYYLKVSAQVFNIYHAIMNNLSLWSIGYRLFEGTGSAYFVNYFKAPPLIAIPGLAPLVSAGLVVAFLMTGMIWAVHSCDVETAFAILVCIIVAISPITWDHYFVMIILSLVVMFRNLTRQSFPAWQTLIFIIITFLLFLFNEHIINIILKLNGGIDYLEAHGNHFTFSSSLLSWLPVMEIIALTILLWRSGINQKRATIEDIAVSPHEV